MNELEQNIIKVGDDNLIIYDPICGFNYRCRYIFNDKSLEKRCPYITMINKDFDVLFFAVPKGFMISCYREHANYWIEWVN